MKSQVPKRLKQIQPYYLDRKMAQRHCEDIEAYFEQDLRKYIKYAVDHILAGSIMTKRQRREFVGGRMRSYLGDRDLPKRLR